MGKNNQRHSQFGRRITPAINHQKDSQVAEQSADDSEAVKQELRDQDQQAGHPSISVPSQDRVEQSKYGKRGYGWTIAGVWVAAGGLVVSVAVAILIYCGGVHVQQELANQSSYGASANPRVAIITENTWAGHTDDCGEDLTVSLELSVATDSGAVMESQLFTLGLDHDSSENLDGSFHVADAHSLGAPKVDKSKTAADDNDGVIAFEACVADYEPGENSQDGTLYHLGALRLEDYTGEATLRGTLFVVSDSEVSSDDDNGNDCEPVSESPDSESLYIGVCMIDVTNMTEALSPAPTSEASAMSSLSHVKTAADAAILELHTEMSEAGLL